MIDYALDKLTSLKYKVLGGIFLVFFLAIGLVLYGVLTYQRDKLITMNSHNAMQIGQTIVAGLSFSMLQNDREASIEIIKNMLNSANLSRISILNQDGQVIMTSEPSLAGMVIDKNTVDACLVCHKYSVPEQRKSTAVIQDGDQSYIRTIIAIENKPACHGCHLKEFKIVGKLFVDSSLDETNTLLKEMAQGILLTSIFVFLLGVFLINFIVTRFFTRPLDALQVGFEKIGQGEFDYWVSVNCNGEISDMADSFNVMTRAIGRYIDEIHEKSNEVSILYSIVERMGSTIEKKQLEELVVDLLCSILQVDSVTLALPFKKHKNTFEIVIKKTGDKRYYHSHFNIESDAPLHCSLTRVDLLQWTNRDFTSANFSTDDSKLLLPLHLENMMIGLICANKADGESFTQPERKIIPVLAHHMTISFANAQLYEMAITDELTALYTKRYFHKEIRKFEEEYRVMKRGFCVMMIDLDHFKETNDSYGHPVGDVVLAQIGRMILTSLRHGDIACRYGGEEFVVLLRGGPGKATMIAERIRKKIEEFSFTINEIPPFHKTTSIGLSCCPQHFCTGDDMIVAADSALYSAKKAGRNQVVMYSSENN